MNLCKKCISLTDNENQICDECREAMKIDNFNEAFDFSLDSSFYHEFESFIKSQKKVLYAYSGGQDSTVVLYLLKELCKKYHTELKIFTIDNGYKGKRTWNNINRVIKHLNLEDNYIVYDIKDEIVTDPFLTDKFGKGNTVLETYAICFMENILPCGKICNTIMDNKYKEILKKEELEYLITGGDTLKITDNHFSIYWTKKNGITIVRGGAAFRISKNIGKDLIKKYNIPWENPRYEGYDTDCLLPGSIFAGKNEGIKEITPLEMIEKYPVVYEYLKERSRMQVIDRETAINNMHELEINNYTGYIETKNIVSKALTRRLKKDV